MNTNEYIYERDWNKTDAVTVTLKALAYKLIIP